MEINYIIIVACLLFLAFLVLKEIKRPDKSRLLWRIVATILSVTSFALLVIPITYSEKKEQLQNELNIVTEGTSVDTIEALRTSQTSDVKSLSYNLKAHSEIQKLNVFGYGLSASELKMLEGYQFSFHPPEAPPGIIAVSWPKKISFSEQFKIQGTYHNTNNRSVKLKLIGLGTNLDSTEIKANSKANFSFSLQPKQIGKAIFNLIVLENSRDTLAAEPVPLEVLPKSTYNVLILASAPDFEHKFLKRWLYENKHSVAFRTKISKDKYSSEFLNQKAANLMSLDQAMLNEVDVAIVDEEEFTNQIAQAVMKGMGVIVRTKTLDKAGNQQPLLRDKSGQITANTKLLGMGKMVSTTLTSTYEWQLAGKHIDYGRFWSSLFAKTLRKKVDSNSYAIESKWPSINEKLRLSISTVNSLPPIVELDNDVAIALRQNMELPFKWDGFFWPKTSGWTPFFINKKVENIYIYKETDWKSAKNFEKLKATENFIANKLSANVKANTTEYHVTREVNKLWFYLIFLIAISFLWYEQRAHLRSL